MFFVQDYRERIKAENPEATFGDVGKLLGIKWREMNENEKKVSLTLFPLFRCHSKGTMMADWLRLALRGQGQG